MLGHLMQRADSFGSCFDLPVSMGALPGHRASGAVATNHDLHASTLQLCNTQHAGHGDSYLRWRKEWHPQRVCFQASILQQVFCFSDVRPAGLLRGSQFQSQGHVSSCTFRALQTHSWVRAVLPIRKKAVGVCLRGAGAMPGSPSRRHLHIQWAPGKELRSSPLLEISQSEEQS